MAEFRPKWPRLNPLAWVAITLAFGLVLYLNVVPRIYLARLIPGSVVETSYGWPWIYFVQLSGRCITTGRLPMASVDYRAFGMDALVSCGLITTTAGLAHWFRRRPTRWHQLGIRDVILMMLVLSVALGAWKIRHEVDLAEDTAAAQLRVCGLGLEYRTWQIDLLFNQWFNDWPQRNNYVMIANSSRSSWASSDDVLPTVGDAEMEIVKRMPYLERIELPYEAGNRGPFVTVRMTDNGLRHLRTLRRLKELNIAQQPVTDAGLAALISLRELCYLDLQGTKVTADGVASMRRANPRLIVVGP